MLSDIQANNRAAWRQDVTTEGIGGKKSCEENKFPRVIFKKRVHILIGPGHNCFFLFLFSKPPDPYTEQLNGLNVNVDERESAGLHA